MGITVTTEQKLDIAPEVVADLSTRVAYINELALEAGLLKEVIDTEKAIVLKKMQEAGIEKAEIDGIPCTIVRGYNSKLDKQKFVELGGSLTQLENATNKKPKKPYVLIGKEKDDRD